MSDWLDQLYTRQPGFEAELVERYTRRLLGLARQQLPERLRARVDPEDVVQSVYRSFFRRLNEDRFSFEDSHDVWRLLATITFCKARNAIKHHQRQRRDVRRETPLESGDSLPLSSRFEDEPGAEDLAVLVESLERLLAGLPELHRTIVVQRLEGDSIEQIARQVERSRRTVLRVLAHVQELGARALEALE